MWMDLLDPSVPSGHQDRYLSPQVPGSNTHHLTSCELILATNANPTICSLCALGDVTLTELKIQTSQS